MSLIVSNVFLLSVGFKTHEQIKHQCFGSYSFWHVLINFWVSRYCQLDIYTVFNEESDFQIKIKNQKVKNNKNYLRKQICSLVFFHHFSVPHHACLTVRVRNDRKLSPWPSLDRWKPSILRQNLETWENTFFYKNMFSYALLLFPIYPMLPQYNKKLVNAPRAWIFLGFCKGDRGKTWKIKESIKKFQEVQGCYFWLHILSAYFPIRLWEKIRNAKENIRNIRDASRKIIKK